MTQQSSLYHPTMTRPNQLDADGLREAIVAYRDVLRSHQEAINRLNVYPVPDGDTGTNMALTLDAVVAEMAQLGDDAALGDLCHALSHGSLMGARGNSGVILSQVLRGIADVLREAEATDGAPANDGLTWAAALMRASKGAYGAVMKPVEGTILTVVRESAEAADERASGGGSLLDVLDAACSAGTEALARTPDLLPVLAEAGVVDAGGAGYLLLLNALLHVVDGRPLPDPPQVQETAAVAAGRADAPMIEAHEPGSGDVSDLRYEVMYFLEAPDETIDAFRDVWAGIGDSIVVVGGDGVWNCHIHTDDIGAAVEAALDCGRPRNIRVTDLAEQVEEERWVREGATEALGEPPAAQTPVTCAVVSVSIGDGIGRILHSLGVQAIVAGGQTMNPSTAELVDAAEACPADEVVILPNNSNIVPVAEQVDALIAKRVRVVPTRSITEGFAALMSYDPEASIDENVVEMADAAANVTAGEVTQAVRASSCDVGPIAEGDWLGIDSTGIRAVKGSIPDAVVGLLEAILADDDEIVTIIEGEGASPADTRHITAWLSEHRPGLAVEVHRGGQPLYPYLVGVE